MLAAASSSLRGCLRVRKGETLVNSIDEPGAIVGEISVLLGSPYSATVEAIAPSRLRYPRTARSFLRDPEVVRLIAVGLAERLNYVTAYLADLKQQYVDAPGLSMVGSVLAKLTQGQQVPVRGDFSPGRTPSTDLRVQRRHPADQKTDR